LMQLVPGLPADFPAGVLVVQHMPALFTRSLAERLDEASQLQVAEAAEGDTIVGGKVLIAPGDYHMTVGEAGKIALDQGPRVHGVRPAVDVTMKSVAEAYGPAVTGVVLTGMGSDGTEGAGRIKAAGGTVIAESESTCAIYGMPQSVVKAGYADRSLPLSDIAAELVLVCDGN